MGINTAERFCAGIFVDQEIVGQPPSPISREFKSEAVRHIAKTPSGPTPFVVRIRRAVHKKIGLLTVMQSVTSSLVRAIHVACKTPTISSIAVIDLQRASHVTEPSDGPPRVHWITSLGLK